MISLLTISENHDSRARENTEVVMKNLPRSYSLQIPLKCWDFPLGHIDYPYGPYISSYFIIFHHISSYFIIIFPQIIVDLLKCLTVTVFFGLGWVDFRRSANMACVAKSAALQIRAADVEQHRAVLRVKYQLIQLYPVDICCINRLKFHTKLPF